MMHPTRAGIGLIRLGDSDFVSANPDDDLRSKAVYDAQGQRIGSVSDLYIDRQDREVRYVEVGAGGFLGIGEKNYLVPVEAVTEVAEDRVRLGVMLAQNLVKEATEYEHLPDRDPSSH